MSRRPPTRSRLLRAARTLLVWGGLLLACGFAAAAVIGLWAGALVVLLAAGVFWEAGAAAGYATGYAACRRDIHGALLAEHMIEQQYKEGPTP